MAHACGTPQNAVPVGLGADMDVRDVGRDHAEPGGGVDKLGAGLADRVGHVDHRLERHRRHPQIPVGARPAHAIVRMKAQIRSARERKRLMRPVHSV